MENTKKDKIIYRTVKPCKVRTIRSTDVYYFEKDKKGNVTKKRAIQYCKDLPTIYVDEQLKITDKPKRTALYLQDSDIVVKKSDITLIEYLDKHPDNIINGGKIFKILDIENDELLQLKVYKLRNKANILLDEKKDNEVVSCAIWLYGNNYTKMNPTRIRIALSDRIKVDNDFTKDVIEYFENKSNSERAILSLGLQHDIITIVKGKTVIWGTDGETIFTASQSKDVIREFALWLKNDTKGRQELSLIAEKLDNKI